MELLGAEVTLVSTGRPRIKNSKGEKMKKECVSPMAGGRKSHDIHRHNFSFTWFNLLFKTTIVSTVSVMPPLQGELERGFTDVLGKFDSLLDTLYDENIVDEGQIIQSTVVRELRSKHDCKRYVVSFEFFCLQPNIIFHSHARL